jgi:hypothetical protein
VVVGDLVTISVDSAFVRDMDGVVTAAGDASIQIKLVSGQYAGYSFTVSKNGGHADAPGNMARVDGNSTLFHRRRQQMMQTPFTLKLGKLPAVIDERTLRFENYLTPIIPFPHPWHTTYCRK